MNTEKQLQDSNKLLKELMSRLNPGDSDEDKQKQEEIEEVKKSIEEYEDEIEKLKKKIDNKDNYKRHNDDLGQNTVIDEVLKETITKEIETIQTFIQQCRKGQETETKKLKEYNSNRETLDEEIKYIEQRLIKDELAKKSNIAKGIHLQQEEINNLRKEIDYRNNSIEKIDKVMELSAEKIRQYGQNITESYNRLTALKKREQNLVESSKEELINKEKSIDIYALRIDKDKLSKLEYVLKTLKNRLQVLMYNPYEEIKKQIAENEKVLSSNNELEEKQSNESVTLEKVEDKKEENSVEVDPSGVKEPKKEDVDLNLFINKLFQETEAPKATEKVEAEEKQVEHKLEHPDENIIKALRKNAEKLELLDVQAAPENLKKEKLSSMFINKWNNWTKKVTAATIELVYDVADKISGKKNELPEVEQSFKDNLNIDGDKEELYKVLKNEGEYTSVNLNDGEQVYIKYGDKQENVPEGVTVRYDGNDMYIYYSKVKGKNR